MRQAALLHLAGAQAKHQTGVVEYVRLAGIVQVDANLLGNANLVSGKAAGIVERLDGIDQVLSNRLVLDGRNLATLGQNSLVVAKLFNHTFLHRGRCNRLSIRYPHIFMRKYRPSATKLRTSTCEEQQRRKGAIVGEFVSIGLNSGPNKERVCMDELFHVSERKSTIGTELRAGLTTFLAMAYIIAVNPAVLSGAGIDAGALACATCLGAGIMTICMGIFANRPLACASGLGVNAMIAGITTTVCGGDWHVAMSVIFLEGVVILLLVLCGLREAIMDAIPVVLRHAISVGLGLFIAMIGLCDAGIITAGAGTLVGLGDITSPTFIVGIISILVTVALACRNVPGSLLIGIVVAVIAGIPLGVTQAPTGIIAPLDFSSIGGPIADAGGVPAIVKVLTDPALLVISFSLLMSDFFDTMGTAMAVAKQGEFLTDDGNVENIKEILIVDSAAAAVGGFMGVSSITTFVESTSGAADGGRTGLTSVTTGVLFILAAFFSPIVTIVSSAATCGALVYVGYLMMSEASEIDWSDVSQGFPAFMIVAGVPFTYSISAGIGLGFIAYVIVALFKGEASKIKPLMWIAALAFLVYFFVA